MESKRVSFNAFVDNNGEVKYLGNNPLKGLFQRWGDSVLYEGDSCFPRTVGIVLGDDSKVYSVIPNSIVVLTN